MFASAAPGPITSDAALAIRVRSHAALARGQPCSEPCFAKVRSLIAPGRPCDEDAIDDEIPALHAKDRDRGLAKITAAVPAQISQDAALHDRATDPVEDRPARSVRASDGVEQDLRGLRAVRGCVVGTGVASARGGKVTEELPSPRREPVVGDPVGRDVHALCGAAGDAPDTDRVGGIRRAH